MAAEADQRIADKHGVSVATVAFYRARDLIETVHWRKVGKSTVYTPEGEALMDELLGTEKKEGAAPVAGEQPPAASPPKEPEKKEGGTPAAGAEEPTTEAEDAAQASAPVVEAVLLVVGLCPNVTFVRVRTPDGQTVAVQIRPNPRVQPNFRIKCRQEGGTWLCIHPNLQPRR